MWWWGPGDGRIGAAGWIGFALMIIFWILVVIAIVFFIRSVMRGSWRESGCPGIPPYRQGAPGPFGPRPWVGGSDALRILEERYARGEIDRDEYLQKKADLLSGPYGGPPGGGAPGATGGTPGEMPGGGPPTWTPPR